MKNIHVLTTDKPSRLYLTTHEYIFEEGYSLSTDECENKHIYITSEEKIKKRDWYFNRKTNKVNKVGHYGHYGYSSKKIILTTDQDLINEGVQAIDDEFLEWFVKNPSCENVEVQKEKQHIGEEIDESYPKGFFDYKIIIPQEEPKQRLEKIASEQFQKDFNNEVGEVLVQQLNKEILPEQIWNEEKMEGIKKLIQKQKLIDIIKSDEELGLYEETLEQAAERWVFDTNGHKWSNNDDTAGDNYGSFIAGYKLAQERGYSGEEVLELLLNCPGPYLTDDEIKEWFNKIKKK